MSKFIFKEYIVIVIAAYSVRTIVLKIIFFIKPLNDFYKKRSIFPGVKIWNNKFIFSIYNQFFGILEISLITILYMLVYDTITTQFIFLKCIVFFIFYEAIIITSKLKFVLIHSEYPISLLIFNILSSSTAIFFACIVIALLYG